MDSSYFLGLLFDKHLLIAATLGGLIGLEREMAGKAPSVRTFALISLGSCMFSLLSVEMARGIHGADPTRIAAQVVSGIGFIGAGTIFRSPKGVSGFTTAALMWATAAIGMAVGFDKIQLALSATLIGIMITVLFRVMYSFTRPDPEKAPNSDG